MSLQPVLDDGEPETGTAPGTCARAVHAVEALRESWQVLGCDADASVAHDQPRTPVLTTPQDRDRTIARRVLDRVGDQVRGNRIEFGLAAPQQARLLDLQVEFRRVDSGHLRFPYQPLEKRGHVHGR